MMFQSTARHFLIDFINLKIKLVQSFECAHRDMMYVRIFMGVHIHMCSELCKKKKLLMCPPPPGPAAERCAVLQPSLQVASHRQPATSQPDRYRRAFNKQMQIGRSCSCWILSMVAEVGGRLQCLWPCGEESTSACCVLSLTDSGVRVSLSLSHVVPASCRRMHGYPSHIYISTSQPPIERKSHE
jgi:hypothetical protein